MNPPRFKLKIPHDTAALVRSMHPDLKRKIKAGLRAILKDSHAGKALKDELDGLRSFRVGKFTIVYRIGTEGATIEIAAIGPRNRIYEETLRFLKKKQ